MGLRERERADTPAPPHPPVPRPADRLRRPLAFAAALGALIAFTSLARPAASPSSRLSIGGDPDAPVEVPTEVTATEDAAGVAGAGDRAPREPGATLRPLDPATLADRPANILGIRPDEWALPSPGGALLAVSDLSDPRRGAVRVVDARTFQPVVTVEVDGSLTDVYGFTPGADGLVLQVGGPDGQSVLRHPLDPDLPVTGVGLPRGTELASSPAMLADARVAVVVVDRRDGAPEPLRSTLRVLVADLVEERVLVDLPLPGLRADVLYGPPPQGASQAIPAFAWDTARERLYVVSADTARVRVVDLLGGSIVAEADFGAPLAEQPDEPGQRWRWAEVSPDGTRLYTAGSESLTSSGDRTVFGLSVIDTATLAEVGRVEDVDFAELSPDGRWLLWSRNADWTGLGSPNEPPRVALMDTTQIGLVHLLGDRTAAYPLGFSRDSSQVYLQRDEMGRGVVVAYALPSRAQTGDRLLAHDAWFEPAVGFLHEGR